MAKVIVVDDSKFMVNTLSRFLQSCGHEVVATGKDGNEGKELYEKFKPDLVLLDITMPNKSGKQCLEEIISTDPNARVVMVTSVSDEKTIGECLAVGAKAFIKKSINFTQQDALDELKQQLNDVLAA